jgi:hypothetical protein
VGLFTIGPLAPQGAVTSTPQASTHASAAPTTSPSVTTGASSEFAFEREAAIDDATARARMANPRTGETWHDPVDRPDLLGAFVGQWDDSHWVGAVLEVGERSGADIVALVVSRSANATEYQRFTGDPDTGHIWGLYEMHEGLPYEVVCPSARTTDPCSADYFYHPEAYEAKPHIRDVFYDSLTFPASVDVGSTVLRPLGPEDNYYSNMDSTPYWGNGWDLIVRRDGTALPDLGGVTLTPLATFGESRLVRVDAETAISGVTNVLWAIETPFGGLSRIPSPFYGDRPVGDETTFVWSDGVPHVSENPGETTAAVGHQCGAAYVYSHDIDHVDSDWVLAGTAPGGIDLFVPVEGGNRVALAVYTRMRDLSEEVYGELYANVHAKRGAAAAVHTDQVPPYNYDSYEAFLADNALVAFQWADGEWFLVLGTEAMHSVYACS